MLRRQRRHRGRALHHREADTPVISGDSAGAGPATVTLAAADSGRPSGVPCPAGSVITTSSSPEGVTGNTQRMLPGGFTRLALPTIPPVIVSRP